MNGLGKHQAYCEGMAKCVISIMGLMGSMDVASYNDAKYRDILVSYSRFFPWINHEIWDQFCDWFAAPDSSTILATIHIIHLLLNSINKQKLKTDYYVKAISTLQFV